MRFLPNKSTTTFRSQEKTVLEHFYPCSLAQTGEPVKMSNTFGIVKEKYKKVSVKNLLLNGGHYMSAKTIKEQWDLKHQEPSYFENIRAEVIKKLDQDLGDDGIYRDHNIIANLFKVTTDYLDKKIFPEDFSSSDEE